MDSSPRTDPTDAAGFAPPADALCASEARYRALAMASADVIYRMSPDWREIRRLDGRGFLADTPEPTDAWLERYILPEDRAWVMAMIEEAIGGKRVFELEHRVVRTDGTAGWTFSRVVPLLDDAGEIVEWIGAASDITARKEAEGRPHDHRFVRSADPPLVEAVAERTWAAEERARAEAALHETQRRLGEALATGRMAYWEWDRSTDTTVASASMDDLFGLLPGDRIESTGQRIAVVHPEDREWYSALVEKAAARRQGWTCEFRIVRPRDGAVIWIEERATVTRDPVTGATRTTGMVWDVTVRKRAEAAAEIERVARDRDALRRQLIQAEEEERRRLTRELHDEAGQHLTALGLGLQALSNVAPPGSEIDRRATELRDLANTLALELHAIAVRLRPRALDDFGLEAALAAHAEEWSRHSGIAVDVHAKVGASRLPTVIESAVYRFVQEALTNVARHSGATHAGIVVERRDGHVTAVVEDDGRGFPVPDPSEVLRKDSGGLGLLGIRERVALLGGTLDVESTPGSGTTLFVRIPLADAAGEAVKAP